MKKTIFTIFMLCASIAIAQTPLTTAPDFTARDVDGQLFNLFSKLDEGKFVLLDFMFTNCGPCQTTAPKLHQAFMNYGANAPNAQLFFVTINRDDNNAVLKNWEMQYMSPVGPYPVGISGTQGSQNGGPQTFSQLYQISAFPTMILIAPNRQILEQDIWPVPTAASFDNFLAPHGITPMPASIFNPAMEFSLSVFPNPANEVLFINTVSEQKIALIRIVDLTGKQVWQATPSERPLKMEVQTSQLSKGLYLIEATTIEGRRGISKFMIEK